MKIVNLILTSQNGGAEQVAVDYCNILQNYLGHDVLAIIKDDAPYEQNFLKYNIKVKKIKNNFGYIDFFAINNLKKILEEFKADVIIAHAGRSMTLARKATKKIKSKKIFDIAVNHSLNVKRSIGAEIIISVNKQIFYKTVDLGQDATRSFIVHNATDISDANQNFEKIDLSKKEEIILGGMGRLDASKGFRFAVRAVKELEKRTSKKIILKIAGSGPKEEFLKQLACELEISKKIEFLGWIKNKKEFFEQIDIFILPSHKETFGLVLLEAFKYRKPVIVSASDGPKEVIRNNIDGILVDLTSEEETHLKFADATMKLISTPNLRDEFVENSYKRLMERFTYKALANSLQDILKLIK